MASPVLQATDLADLSVTTLRNLGRFKFTDLSSVYQKHIAWNHLMRKNKITFRGGKGIQFNLMVAQTGAAANVGMGAQDNVNIANIMTTGSADWRNSTTNWAIDGREISMNEGEAVIVELISTRRFGAWGSFAELAESNFWGPPVALSDVVTPWGVNTWFCKSATQGFNGTVPSGYTTIGGLNPTSYPNWANYTDGYTNVSRDDFIYKARRMARFTGFEPLVQGMPQYATGAEPGYYTNYGVIGPLEETLASQNEDLGNDIASMDTKLHLRRIPIEWVPRLEPDTTNPFYQIPWSVFHTYILSGWWGKETHITNVPGQHTVQAHFIDFSYQWVAKDRRQGGVISNGVTYPS